MKQLQQRRIILTGNPRIGKTTIVRRVLLAAKEKNLVIAGVMTPEILERGKRKGFQIVDLKSGKKGILASLEANNKHFSKWRVGRYRVHKESLNEIAIPAIREVLEKSNADLLVIDEIGKMEVLDANFAALAMKAIGSDDYSFSTLATLGHGIPKSLRAILEIDFIEKMHVEISNRDQIAKDLQKWIQEAG
ncbi:MAG: nucleoside-triphosphatase [Candidatus Hodarchaeota archaeon]